MGIGIAVAAFGVIRVLFHRQDPWQENVCFAIFLILFLFLITVIPTLLKKRGRKLLLQYIPKDFE